MNAARMDRNLPLWIGLIRAIGGATHAKLSMAQLRQACEAAGFQDVRTVLATGNVIFRSPLPEPDIQRALTAIIAAHDLDNQVFLRQPADLRQAMAANPFPAAAKDRPSRLLVMFLGGPTQADGLPKGYSGPEQLRAIGRDVYIDYPETIGQSKLTPARLERHLGQPGTARNWNTVGKILTACED